MKRIDGQRAKERNAFVYDVASTGWDFDHCEGGTEYFNYHVTLGSNMPLSGVERKRVLEAMESAAIAEMEKISKQKEGAIK